LTTEQVPARRGWMLTIDNRFLPPILITSILLGANLSFGILEGWERTALSIVAAIGTELVLRAHYLRQVAAPGKRLHQRYQRRYPHSIAVLVAVLLHELHLHPLQIRPAAQGDGTSGIRPTSASALWCCWLRQR
jgi:hypothetical protein